MVVSSGFEACTRGARARARHSAARSAAPFERHVEQNHWHDGDGVLSNKNSSRLCAERTRRGRRRVRAGASSSAAPDLFTGDEGSGRVARDTRVRYTRCRFIVFVLTTICYAVYYITRVSINFVAPSMLSSPGLDIDITSIGYITTVFPIFYGCSKLVSGVVGDR